MFQHTVLSVMPYHMVGPPGDSLNTQHVGQYQQYGGVSHPRVQHSRGQQGFFCRPHFFISTLLQQCLWWIKVQ